MSKAEEFIGNCTRTCSNKIGYCHNKTRNHNHVFYNWLTPEKALRAVEIAREETIEKACDVIRHKYGHYHYLRGDITEELIKEFVKAMKDE